MKDEDIDSSYLLLNVSAAMWQAPCGAFTHVASFSLTATLGGRTRCHCPFPVEEPCDSERRRNLPMDTQQEWA